MKKCVLWTVAYVLVLGGTSIAHAQTPQQQPTPARDLLTDADANHDGKVTYDEAKAIRPMMTPERFKEYDRDGDGVLTKEDFPEDPGQFIGSALLKADADKDGLVTPEEFKAAFPKVPPERFTMLDRNKDGVISKADLPDHSAPPLRLLIEKADADKDGKVTFEEMKALRPSITQEQFKTLDRNKDGVLTKEDAPAAPRTMKEGSKEPNPMAGFIERADKDKDGKASYDEVKAVAPEMTPDLFSKLDKNGDGFLTVDEQRIPPGKH